jgi:hypothetical protein
LFQNPLGFGTDTIYKYIVTAGDNDDDIFSAGLRSSRAPSGADITALREEEQSFKKARRAGFV